MALQELILSSSSTLTCLHDLKTGSLLTSFKGASATSGSDFSNDPQASSSATYGGSSSSNGKGKNRATEEEQNSLFRKTTDSVETKDGMGGIVASVIAGKAAINVWSYQKEAPLHRLLLPVKVTCLALSKSGNYLACGGHDGRVFLWEIATGALIASFDAHYRAVTCLAWTDDDAAFISGGDDSACHVWSLPIVIASAGNTLSPVTAYTSLTDHTLPITSLALSFGKFPRLKLLSSSLDGSCKIWDLSLKTTPLLSTFSFAGLGSTRVTNVTWDILERSFYAALAFPSTTQDGKEKSGRVVKVDLYRQVRENEAMPDDGDDEDEEDKDENPDRDAEGAGTGRYVALGGGGRGDITQVSEKDATALGRYFSTPSDYISSLQFSTLSSHLIVGTQAGKVHILSLPSMQVIRTIVPSQTSSISSLASPITYLRSMIRPVDLITRTGTSSGTIGGNKTNEAELLPRPVAAQLSRTLLQPNSKEAEERIVNIRLTGNGVSKSPFAIDDIILPAGSRRNNTRRTGGRHALVPSATSAGNGAASAVNTQALQEENARLREQLARSIAFNDRMWESVVDTTLAKAKEGKTVQGETKTNGMHVD